MTDNRTFDMFGNPASIPDPPAVQSRETARARRDDGMERAIEHAEAVNEGWKDEAHRFVRIYAESHDEFLTEDVREYAASCGFEPPTDGRSWGAIATAAAKRGVIVKCGARAARSSNLSFKTLWRSLVRK